MSSKRKRNTEPKLKSKKKPKVNEKEKEPEPPAPRCLICEQPMTEFQYGRFISMNVNQWYCPLHSDRSYHRTCSLNVHRRTGECIDCKAKLSECPICLDTIQHGDQYSTTCCQTVYHMDCLSKSLDATKERCPTCDKPVESEMQLFAK